MMIKGACFSHLGQLKLRFMDSMAENDPWLPAPVDPDGKPAADSNPDVIIDDYIAATYRLYLSGEDQFPDQLQVLEDFFGPFLLHTRRHYLTLTPRSSK
jgi:hypothetical protein